MSISELNTRTNITIPKSLKQEIELLAKRENRSMNNLIITILKSYVESQKAKFNEININE